MKAAPPLFGFIHIANGMKTCGGDSNWARGACIIVVGDSLLRKSLTRGRCGPEDNRSYIHPTAQSQTVVSPVSLNLQIAEQSASLVERTRSDSDRVDLASARALPRSVPANREGELFNQLNTQIRNALELFGRQEISDKINVTGL
jgi:hypothetical protein